MRLCGRGIPRGCASTGSPRDSARVARERCSSACHPPAPASRSSCCAPTSRRTRRRWSASSVRSAPPDGCRRSAPRRRSAPPPTWLPSSSRERTPDQRPTCSPGAARWSSRPAGVRRSAPTACPRTGPVKAKSSAGGTWLPAVIDGGRAPVRPAGQKRIGVLVWLAPNAGQVVHAERILTAGGFAYPLPEPGERVSVCGSRTRCPSWSCCRCCAHRVRQRLGLFPGPGLRPVLAELEEGCARLDEPVERRRDDGSGTTAGSR